LNKFKTEEFSFISYGDKLFDHSFSLPTRLFNIEGPENLLLEITSYTSNIKLTYYLPVVVPKPSISVNKYIIKNNNFVFMEFQPWTNKVNAFKYIVPDEVKLYYMTSLDEWSQAIEMTYHKIITAIQCGEFSTEFTYYNTLKNLMGRDNDIGYNIINNVNNMLKQNNFPYEISLTGFDVGSSVRINHINK
jgi:hypothetical protein